MLNQAFSAENFRKIFDYENRKGNYLESDFFPEIEKITKEIKDTSVSIRQHRKAKHRFNIKEYEEKIEELNKKKNDLKEQKENLLSKELNQISTAITEKTFSLELNEIDIGKEKKAYGFKRNPISYFALKQIQNNLRKLYKVKQGNRHSIVCQLRETLADKLPKHIIRTDISSFYESIPRDRLLKKLKDDPLLTETSKKIIYKILHEYKKLSNSETGLPRGVGISAYLSEIYLRKFDEKISREEFVLYYARYVDDIVIICNPDNHLTLQQKTDFIRKELKAIDLSMNKGKTICIDLSDKTEKRLEYLGYMFSFGTGHVKIELTKDKVKKYINRINRSFEDYQKKVITNKNKAKSLLIKRIRFLTGNTRLVNNKKNAVVGVYFSYPLMNKLSRLQSLDKFLGHMISSIQDQKLKQTLAELSFVKGFEQKRFFKFSANDLKNIVKAWKYEA